MHQAGQGLPAADLGLLAHQPYQGICACGEVKRHATGNPDAVKSYVDSNELHWHHHH
jgi:hypothetical protein